jgi:hypothetical protein
MATTRTTPALSAIGSSLEDAFFLQQDRALIERLAELRKMAESKEVLAKVSGITNQEILERLVAMNVRPETLTALALVPLIEVVWADGEVDDDERRAVLEQAASQRIAPGSSEYELLERWLSHRPEDDLMRAWQHYAQGLCEHLSSSQRDVLRRELSRGLRKAAEASGGFLGLGKISSREKEVLERIESAFCAPPESAP